jgi:DNA-binding NarL/FixJ family response regulator
VRGLHSCRLRCTIETAKFADCVAKLKQSAADVAVVFLDEQPGAGCVILEEIKKTQDSIFAFAVSSERSAEIIVKAIRAGADELISSIPTEEELLKALPWSSKAWTT